MAKDDTHQIALDRFQACEEYYFEEYDRADHDERFLYGEQWDDYAKQVRGDRPCLVENRLLPFKHQVLNNIKQANLSIQVSPVDSEADPETAEILQGIIRNIEVTSNAQVAYDTAADKAIGGGRGFIRILTRYSSYDSFDKEIYIDRVLNPNSVYIDPNSKTMDGSDMEFAFIFDDVPRDEFERMWPDADPCSFDAGHVDDWVQEHTVRVAEYFYKDYKARTLYLLPDGTTTFDESEDAVDSRESEECTIKWVKLSGKEVLEETDFEGDYIPIVPVYGEEAWINGRRKMFSLIHQAKDPQRALNYWKSANTEVMALQPKAPYVGPVGSFQSKQNQWQAANINNPAFLEYDPIIVTTDTGQSIPMPPPQREAPPQSSPGMESAMMMNQESIKAVLGMFDSSQGRIGNEISGVALKQGALMGDNANFHFVDNLGISIRHVGVILVGLIPLIMSKPQIARIIGADDSREVVPINMPYVETEDGLIPFKPDARGVYPAPAPSGIYDLSVGKYDIVVNVGPNYATKRQEKAAMLMEFAQSDPRVLEVGADILVKNLDMPDGDELVKRIKSIMDPAILGDDPTAQKLQQATEAAKQLQEQLISMQIKLDEKQNNQVFENELKLKQLEADNTQFAITAKQKDKEIEIRAMEAAGKVNKDIPGSIPPEVVSEIGMTLDELLGSHEAVLSAVEAIVEAKEKEATSQPRGLLSRIMGRNPNGVVS